MKNYYVYVFMSKYTCLSIYNFLHAFTPKF